MGMAPRPASDVSWLVETRGVTVASRRCGVAMSIVYPYAGLWAMVADGSYTPDRARDLMALLMATSPQDAEKEVVRTLAVWLEMGYIAAG